MRQITAIAVGCAAVLGCGPQLVDGPDTTAVTNATVIDGTGSVPRQNTTIVIEQGRVTQILDAKSVRFGPDVDVVDASGQWVVPGFVDTHGHVLGARSRAARLQTLLDHGITAARSPASVTARGVAVRDSVESGMLRGPTFRVAGALLDAPGSPYGFAIKVTDEEQVRAEVRAQAEAGVDFIKVYTLLEPNLVEAAIEEAHGLDLQVIGHLGRTRWDEAVRLGIDALTHSAIAGMATVLLPAERRAEFADLFVPNPSFDPRQLDAWIEAAEGMEERARQFGQVLADAGVVLDPNLVLMEAILRGNDPALYEVLVPGPDRPEFAPHPVSAMWTAEQFASAKRALPLFFEAVRLFHESGALVTVGTDIGNPWMRPGVSYHRELELLSQAGLSNMDVLLAATRNGASALGMLDELGTIEVGKRADLVVLGGDPLDDITQTRAIVHVLQHGVDVDRH